MITKEDVAVYTKVFLYLVLFFSIARCIFNLYVVFANSGYIDFQIYHIFTSIVAKGVNPFDPQIHVILGGAQQAPNYPPLFFILMRPAILAPLESASLVWLVLNQIFTFGSFALILRLTATKLTLASITLIVFAMANFYPLHDTNWLGQMNTLILFLLTLSLVLFKKKHILLAAIIVALVVHTKIQFALFLPVFFLVGYKRLALNTTFFTLIGWVISYLVLGREHNMAYLQYILHFPKELLNWPANISIVANISRFFDNDFVANILTVVVFLLLIILFLKILPWKATHSQAGWVWYITIVAVLIFSPLLEIHHFTVALLPIFLLAFSNKKELVSKKFYAVILAISVFMLGNLYYVSPDPVNVHGIMTLPLAVRLLGLFGLIWLFPRNAMVKSIKK